MLAKLYRDFYLHLYLNIKNIILNFGELLEMKKLIVFILLFSYLFCMTSCLNVTNLFDTMRGMSKAYHLAEDFLYALEAEDYNKVLDTLHPDCELANTDIEKYISTIEEELEIDFSQGMYIIDGHTTPYRGKDFEKAFDTEIVFAINNTAYSLSVLIVDTEDGFGIYSITISNK